jgi:hypothetical protein
VSPTDKVHTEHVDVALDSSNIREKEVGDHPSKHKSDYVPLTSSDLTNAILRGIIVFTYSCRDHSLAIMAKLPALAKSKRQHEGLKALNSSPACTILNFLTSASTWKCFLNLLPVCARLENAIYALLIHSAITYRRTHSAQLM